jgi:hypothetical protein
LNQFVNLSMATYSPPIATVSTNGTLLNVAPVIGHNFPVGNLVAVNGNNEAAAMSNGAAAALQRPQHVPPPANSIVLTIRMLMSGKVRSNLCSLFITVLPYFALRISNFFIMDYPTRNGRRTEPWCDRSMRTIRM